jgi:NADP-dependent 3-hydroxy acid dehydrogenase YdfG
MGLCSGARCGRYAWGRCSYFFLTPILTKSPFRVFAHGAKVTVVARDADGLGLVRARLGIATISADVTVETAAQRILREVHPDILVLNAGAKPRMGRLDQLSWAISV